MIDELGLWRVVNNCAHLKFRFEGVYSADNFPVTFRGNTFVIVNSEKDGTHWLLYCNRERRLLWRPTGFTSSILQEHFLSSGFD